MRSVTTDPQAAMKSAVRTTPTVDSYRKERPFDAVDEDGYAASRQLYR